MTDLHVPVRRASPESAVSASARLGLVVRGVLYLVIGWLAIDIARGQPSHQANQRGALAEIGARTDGIVLLWIMAAGFAAYAFWRLSEAVYGTAAAGRKTGPRLQSLARGIFYAALCVSTVLVIASSSSQSQSHQQATLTARTMRHAWGRWLVGGVGVLVVAIGLAMVAQGLTRRFEKDLQMNELSGSTRRIVVGLGTVGTTARGLVFGLAGALVIDAAVTFRPGKSKGLDGALRALAGEPYGQLLLGVVAAGLLAFGLYGLTAAKWAKT